MANCKAPPIKIRSNRQISQPSESKLIFSLIHCYIWCIRIFFYRHNIVDVIRYLDPEIPKITMILAKSQCKTHHGKCQHSLVYPMVDSTHLVFTIYGDWVKRRIWQNKSKQQPIWIMIYGCWRAMPVTLVKKTVVIIVKKKNGWKFIKFHHIILLPYYSLFLRYLVIV